MEILRTFMGNQATGLIKGLHNSQPQGPSSFAAKFCARCFGHAQDDRTCGHPGGADSQRVTPITGTPPPSPAPAKIWGLVSTRIIPERSCLHS